MERLNEMEDRPWPEWRRGKPLTQNSLARLLKPFGVLPRNLRMSAGIVKGYERGPIEDAHKRYGVKVTHSSPDSPTNFPASEFKDQVDALSGAFAMLIGAPVFATLEEFIRAPLTRIPSTWARVAVLDVDQARIGITWGAHDRTADVAYVYDCVVTPRSDLSLLAATLRDRGAWVPVLMDAEVASAPRPEGLRFAESLNEFGVNVY